MSALDCIAAHGNRGKVYLENNKIVCADGASLSVIAGEGTYCTPRPTMCREFGSRWHHGHNIPCTSTYDDVACDYAGPYTHVEVMPSGDVPESWAEYGDGDGVDSCVFGRVPVEMVREFIASHGGAA